MAKSKFKTHSTAADAYVVFYPFRQESTYRVQGVLATSLNTFPVVVHTEILNIATHKPKTGAGTWSVTLSSNQRYKRFLHPGCWAAIYMSDQPLTEKETSGLKSGLKMIGVVRSIREVENTDEDGRRQIRYQVSGDDFHSFFNTTIYVNPILQSSSGGEADPASTALEQFGQIKDDTFAPHEIVSQIVNACLGKSTSIASAFSGGARAGGNTGFPTELGARLFGKPPAGNKFVNAIHLSLQDTLLGKMVVSSGFGSKLNVWSLMQQYGNTVLNELFTDLMPIGSSLRPTVVMRAIPFSSANKKYDRSTLSLKDNLGKSPNDKFLYVSKVISENEILNFNHGRTDAERFNYFFVSANNTNDGSTGVNFADFSTPKKESAGLNQMADVNSIVRHGLRPYILSGGVMSINFQDMVTANYILRDIWYPAHFFENGQITLKGSAEHIPVGTTVQWEERDWIAHVEQVEHQYSVSGDGKKNFRTILSFVRLQNTSGKPIDQGVSDESQSYEPGKNISFRATKKIATPTGDGE